MYGLRSMVYGLRFEQKPRTVYHEPCTLNPEPWTLLR
jgi:hypothetical protein